MRILVLKAPVQRVAAGARNAETLSCDVAVIGAGAAGLAADHAAKATNAKVLLIEAGEGGTTCARRGCMPTRRLIAVARRARLAAGAAPLAIRAGPEIDCARVMGRVHRERDARR